jgi:DNA-binding IclR family transcriptional regulator
VPTRTKHRGATARNLELLRCIAMGSAEFSLKSLADHSGLPASTVHRLIEQWVQRDFLQHDGPKSYRVGPELFRLAALILQKFEVRRLARPLLAGLCKQWQETAALCLFSPSTLSGNIAESMPSPHPLKYELAVNSVVSLAWGSLGRAILAHLPTQDIDSVLIKDAHGPLSHSPLPPRRSMLRELSLIRARRYATYHSQPMNIAGISAPVAHADGRVIGSIGVIMPASRFSRSVQERLPAAVIESARKLGTLVTS